MRPEKHSLTLHGHRTSVTLEPAFWRAFRNIARETDTPINALAAKIDDARGEACGLATAIRLFVLEHLQQQLGATRSDASPSDVSPPPRAR